MARQAKVLNFSDQPVPRGQVGADLTRATSDNRYVQQGQGLPWFSATGAEARTSLASYAGQAVSNPPTQAEVQALDNALKAHSRAMVALINDLRVAGALTT